MPASVLAVSVVGCICNLFWYSGCNCNYMPDYGHPLNFGLSLIPSVDLVDENPEFARLADEAELDYLGIQARSLSAWAVGWRRLFASGWPRGAQRESDE